jgi:hypothetical protein
VKDGAVLMYMKDNVLYPVAMSEEQWTMLQMTANIFAPLKVVFDKPQGKAVNLMPDKEEK